jgi:hypothetical protein
MLAFVNRIVLALRLALDSRASREAQILVLRQRLLVLNRKSRRRVRLQNIDRLILVWLYQLFPSVLDAIAVVMSAVFSSSAVFRARCCTTTCAQW